MISLRLRYVKDGIEKMKESGRVIVNPEDHKGQWIKVFGNSNPIHVEFGSGLGGFIAEMAKTNPAINYLAFERNSKVIVKGLNKLEDDYWENFYFVHSDIRKAQDFFNPSVLERIYLNFSDPWPKKKHHKRRLTHRRFLNLYKELLIPKGEIHFKTDNDDLFQFSIIELEEMGWEISLVTRDLHNSPYQGGNIMTEYEEKFVKKGKNINKLIAISPKE